MPNAMKVYCAIATGQALPNLIPLLQLGADRVVIVASKEMQDKAEEFRTLLTKRLARFDETDVIVKTGLPSQDIDRIEDWGCNWLIELQEHYPGAKLMLNATGGNKLITLGLTRAFEQDDNAAVLYTDTQHEQIEWLQPRRQKPLSIKPVLELDSALQAMGLTPRRAQSDDAELAERMDARWQVTKWLAENADQLEHFFVTLAATLHQDKGSDGARCWTLASPVTSRLWEETMDKLEKAELIDRDESERFYLKRGDESRRYLTGGWLEEYVWRVLRNEDLQDVRLGLEFTANHAARHDVRNELDVVAMIRNRLLVIECKVRRLNDDQKIADIIYKLDSLSDAARGIFALRWLVNGGSMGKDKSLERNQARARGNDINVVTSSNLKQLPQQVRQWKQNADLGKFPL